MRIHSYEHEHDREIGVIPLINVVLLLLVFFMLAGRITPQEMLTVDPPFSRSGAAAGTYEALVLISEDGRIAFGDYEVEEHMLGSVVAEQVGKDPDVWVKIKADSRVDSAVLIRVLTYLQEAGIERVLLLTAFSGAQ